MLSRYSEITDYGVKKYLVKAEGNFYQKNCGKEYQNRIYVKCCHHKDNPPCPMKGIVNTENKVFQKTKGTEHNHEPDVPPDSSAQLTEAQLFSRVEHKFPLPISRVREINGKNVIIYTKYPYIAGMADTPRILYINLELIESTNYDFTAHLIEDNELLIDGFTEDTGS